MKTLLSLVTVLTLAQSAAAQSFQKVTSAKMINQVPVTNHLSQKTESFLQNLKQQQARRCSASPQWTKFSYEDLQELMKFQLIFSSLSQNESDVEEQRDLILTSRKKFEIPQDVLQQIERMTITLNQELPQYFNNPQSLKHLMSLSAMELGPYLKTKVSLQDLGNYTYLYDYFMATMAQQLETYKLFLIDPIPCVTFKEVAYIRFYTMNGNYYLHLNHDELLPPIALPIAKKIRQQISTSLKKFPITRLPVYVGSYMNPEEAKTLRVGQSFGYKNFLSGSTDQTFKSFAKNLVLIVKNKTGRWIKLINSFESEVIFENPTFIIKQIQIDEENTVWLSVEEL